MTNNFTKILFSGIESLDFKTQLHFVVRALNSGSINAETPEFITWAADNADMVMSCSLKDLSQGQI